jgi:radical SAM protein with 4Fe4S-binding SPASM domain
MKSKPYSLRKDKASFFSRLQALNPYPLHTTIELLDQCNLKCIHCYKEETKKPTLNIDQIKEVLTKLKEAKVLIITFTGGEVTLREDLFEILKYSRHLRFYIRLFTNGYLFKPEWIKRFLDLGIGEVHISLYSHEPDLHDQITQTPGSFSHTLNTIKLLKEQKIKVIIKTPLMNLNFHHYPHIITLAQRLNLAFIFDPIIFPKKLGTPSPLRLKKEQLFLLLNDRRLFSPPKDKLLPRSGWLEKSLCGAGKTTMAITSNGKVKPCLMLPIELGDILKDNITTIWNSTTKLKQIKNWKWKDVPKCRNCDIIGYCNLCPALAFYETKNFQSAALSSCELAQTMKKITHISTCEVRS